MRVPAKLALLLLAAAAGACKCGHGAGQLTSADALPSAPNLDFGAVPIGQSETLALKLTNSGTIPLQVTKTTLGGANPGSFHVMGTFPAGITSSGTVNIQFAPAAGQTYSATLTITSNSNTTPALVVTLTGSGSDVSIVATPQPLNFGDVLVGTSVTLPLTLTNQGTSASATLTPQPLTGSQAAEFSQVSTPAVVQPGKTMVLQVTFSPTALGAASASIPVVLCANCSVTNLTLVGQGVQGALTFVPTPIAFANVPAGQSVPQTVTATNSGSAAIQVGTVSLQSGRTAPFSLSGLSRTPPFTLQPAQSFTVVVTYAPLQTTGDSDALAVAYEATSGDGGLGIPTTGTDPIAGNNNSTPCQLTVTPSSVNFGNVQLNQAVTKSFAFGNTGQLACDVSNLHLDPSSDPAFALPAVNPTALTIPPGGSATIQVACDITSGMPSLRKGALDFNSNDTNHINGSVPLVASLGQPSPYAPGWPKWHMDNTDRGQSEADTTGVFGNVLWRFPVAPPTSASSTQLSGNTQSTYLNSPVVGGDGTIYQTTMDGHLIAVFPDGGLRWTAPISSPASDPHPATPIIAADNSLYLESGTDQGAGPFLYHFSPSGQQLSATPPLQSPCRPQTDAFGNTTCLPADGFDVCPSIGQSGLIFDADDFGQTTTYTPSAGGTLTPGTAVLLDTFGERMAVALDQNDNSYWSSAGMLFGLTKPGAGFGPIPGWSAGCGGLLSAIGDNPAACTDLSPGADAFDQMFVTGEGFANSDLAFDADHTGWLMVEEGAANFSNSANGGNGGTVAQTWLMAVDPANGAVKWTDTFPQYNTPSNLNFSDTGYVFSADFGNSAPAIADDGTVYVGNGNGLYAVDGVTGNLKPGFPFLTADVDTAVAIGGDGTVFFGCSDGTFYGVNPNGTQRLKLVTGGRISSSPAIGPDGTVYFVSDEGNLYAVH